MEIKRTNCAKNKGEISTGIRKRMSRLALFTLIFIMLAAAIPISASAEEIAQPQGWQFGADIYMWISGMGGETAGGDTIDVPFDTLIENLDFTYMGAFHARNGKLHLSTDVIYMDLEGDNSGRVTLPGGNEIKAEATVKFQSWIVTPAVGYSVLDTERVRMEVLAGARYLYMKPELEFDITGPLDSRGNDISTSGDIWDGIVGIRGEMNLAENWYVPYYADLGTGDSDYTWQAMAGVGYRINRMVDVVAAYRYLEWKFEDNKVFDTLNISGPLVGLRFRF
jgi:opacity protein-like surface antigen